MDNQRREALLKEYSEVCSTFRMLTDIRFKLLGFLPIATIAAATFKKDEFNSNSFILSLFGLIVTTGLIIYNGRNDQLYDELRGRGASIERDLGLPEGMFGNRPNAWLTIGMQINHGNAVNLIYGASIAVWLFGVLMPVLNGINCILLLLNDNKGYLPLVCIMIFAIILAVGLTWVMYKYVESKKKTREKEMRQSAANAVQRVRGFFDGKLTIKPEFYSIAEIGDIFNSIFKDKCLQKSCKDLSTEEVFNKGVKLCKDLNIKFFYNYCLPDSNLDEQACFFVALLTDLPYQWLLKNYRVTKANCPNMSQSV